MSQCSELSIGTSASYWSPYKSKVNHLFILCQPFSHSLSTISSFFVNHFLILCQPFPNVGIGPVCLGIYQPFLLILVKGLSITTFFLSFSSQLPIFVVTLHLSITIFKLLTQYAYT